MKLQSIFNKGILITILIALLIGAGGAPSQAKAFGLSSITGLFNQDDTNDDRAARLDAYFAKRDMPLEGYGSKFVEVADANDLDWRLLPAIAVRESSGGKHLMNNNPFGWGSAKIKFDDFNEAIEEVGTNLSGNDEHTAKYYKDKTVYQILWLYNGTVLKTYPKEVMNIMKMF